jgi:hypothetical protein
MSIASASSQQSQQSHQSSTPPNFLTEGDYDYQAMDQHRLSLPHPPSDPPSIFLRISMGRFFSEFWIEFKELVQELIHYGRTKTWKKKMLTVIVTVCSLFVFYDLVFGNVIIQYLEHFIHWMTEYSSVAVVAFVGIFVISTRKYY